MRPEPPVVDAVRNIRRERPKLKRVRGKAGESAIRVRFASGVDARLNPESPRDRVWAEVLESLRDSGEPAYVEIDSDTSYISSLLLPRSFIVTAIRETPQSDLEIELEISHARHVLRRDHPRFEELHAVLERARREKTRVLVTESLDSAAIIDVRPAAAGTTRDRQ
jgi:hypothetical protein